MTKKFSTFSSFFLLLGFLTSLGSQTQASEQTNLEGIKNTFDENTLPSGYKHARIADQLDHFRNIYDAAYQKYKSIDDLRTKPIDGLDKIIFNTYALVRDHIDQDTSREPENKQKYLYPIKLKESILRVKNCH